MKLLLNIILGQQTEQAFYSPSDNIVFAFELYYLHMEMELIVGTSSVFH